jgi:2'-5' RNA ligase
MAVPAIGRGHSLWLMPEGAAFDRLAGWIRRLAERYGTDSFPPHVTLLSALEGPAPDLLATAERAAADLSPFTMQLDGLSGRDEHFRCVFVPAVATGPLRAAHGVVARAFGRAPEPSFLPHLSLVYGTLRPAHKAGLAREIGTGADARFEARRLHLWSTDGAVRDWREAGVFPFVGR